MLYQLSYSRESGLPTYAPYWTGATRITAPPPDANGGEGDRTPDLVNAIHALSQLSYAPGTSPPAGTVNCSGGYGRMSMKQDWRNRRSSVSCSAFDRPHRVGFCVVAHRKIPSRGEYCAAGPIALSRFFRK